MSRQWRVDGKVGSDLADRLAADAVEEVAILRFDVDAAVGNRDTRIMPLLGKRVARRMGENDDQILRTASAHFGQKR